MSSTTTPAPVTWFEIAGSDTAKIEAFYGELFGWSFGDGPTGPSYRMAAAGDGAGGGVTVAQAGLPESYAIFFVQVEDVAATCDQLRQLGGEVLVGPEAIPEMGLTFANVKDPSGNHFGLFTPPAA